MLLNHNKEYEVDQPAYSIFQSIEKLDFSSNLLFSNRYNLIPSIENTGPLEMTFYLDKSLMRPYIPKEMSTKLRATFVAQNNKTTIVTSVRTSPFICLWYTIGIIGVVASFFQEEK
jgi:hypothetical protein